jgi:hypothetical protein
MHIMGLNTIGINYKDHNIFIFNYEFNIQKLKDEYQSRIDQFKEYAAYKPDGSPVVYEGKEVILPHWKVVRFIEFDYANEICEIFKIKARPRFFVQDANSTLRMHKDSGTECSINILLDYKNPAKVDFEDQSYSYNQCLLNTQNIHGVKNTNEKRILFKLSIRDETYESVCRKIEKVIN